MKNYYVITNSLSEGITAKALEPIYHSGKLAHYFNSSTKSNEDNYYDKDKVFEDYDDALAAFCNEAAKQLNYHKAQITIIEQAKNQVLEN
jgi:hypothetical protein